MDTKRLRVLVADDHTLVSAAISKLIEQEYDLIGSVYDGRTLVSTARASNPDVILLDLSMPGLNGLEAARRIKADNPKVKIVFVTVHAEMHYVVEAFRAGASGYVLKNSAASELIKALNAVAENDVYLTSLISRGEFEKLLHSSKDTAQVLSTRQLEVLQLVSEGHTAKEIAKLLRVSPKTVEFHKGLIMKRLNLHSTAELTRYAMETGISVRLRTETLSHKLARPVRSYFNGLESRSSGRFLGHRQSHQPEW